MAERKRLRPTLQAVANEAGVSTATVSNALRGTGRLSEPTRLKVLAAARTLSYTAANSARAMAPGKTGVLGLTMTTYGDSPVRYTRIPYYRELILAAIEAANDRGYLLVVIPSTTPSWLWLTTPLDGVIHCEPRATDPVRAILLQRDIPMVSEGRPIEPAESDAWVDSDNTRATTLLLDHLRDAGAERTALILPRHDDAFPELVHPSYLAWCQEAGQSPLVETFAAVPDYVGSEVAAIKRLLARRDRPDAMFGIYSDSGLNILGVARERRLAVPDDLLVACISEDPVYDATTPPVTTVSLQPHLNGAEAVDLLLALVNRRRGVERTRVTSPVLHARASTRS